MLVEFSAKELAVARRDARDEFYFFTRWMMLRERGLKWLRAPHHPLIAAALMRVFRLETLRLIINLPPRYSKTFFVQAFVAWALGHYPDSEFIYSSFSAELAEDKSREMRDLVTSAEYRAIFPRVDVRWDSKAVNNWKTTAGGVVHAAGAGGTITGFGGGKRREGFGGALIVDDPNKPDVALSEVERNKVLRWFPTTFENRRNSPHTPIVVIMQRLHEQDLAGWLLEGGDGEKWEHLCLPVITDEGQALWPEMHSLEELERKRKADAYLFAGQYMQRPVPVGGAFFHERNLLIEAPGQDEIEVEKRIYRPVESVRNITLVFATIDTNVKTGKDCDGTAVVYFGYSRYFDANLPEEDRAREGKSSLTILDWDYRQFDGALLEAWLPTVFTLLEELSAEVRALQGSAGAFIEDKSSGTILLQQAANNGWPARPIESGLTALGKSERAVNVSGYVHSGKVKFRRAAYEKVIDYKGRARNHLLSQILAFNPTVKDQGEDDALDAWSYGLALSLGNPDGF